MSKNLEGQYLVDAGTTPVIVKVVGRANYLNCRPLADFFEKMLAQNKLEFSLHLGACTSMDSTFLGIITSLAIRLAQKHKGGFIRLYQLSERNLELVHNMGLDRILSVEIGDLPQHNSLSTEQALPLRPWEAAHPELILKAHQALVAIHEANKHQFQDLLTFLQREIDHPSS